MERPILSYRCAMRWPCGSTLKYIITSKNGSYRTSFLRSVVSLQVNSSASATLNATKVAVTNGSLRRTWMVGPEFLFFDIYVCFCFLPEMGPQIGSSPTNLTSVRLCRSGGETGGGATWRVPGVYRSSLC